MRVALSLLLAMVLMPIVSMQTANAQDNAVYVVSYVDVAPAARATAANLLRQLANWLDGAVRCRMSKRVLPSSLRLAFASWRKRFAAVTRAAGATST